MTVPPNYGPPPEQPQTPGYGYQSPYDGGQSGYGSQPQYGGQAGAQPPYGQEPQYGGAQQPPYGQEPPGGPYGGPVLPPEPPKRNLGLIGGVVVGVTVLVLGTVLLVTMNLRDDGDNGAAEDPATSEDASEGATSPEEEATTPEESTDSEVGQCLPFESEISGDGFTLVDCSDATAFWEITAQSYDVTDVAVDSEGYLTDLAAVDELCGAGWGLLKPGETWTKYDYVYSSGTLDSLYCVVATGAPDPAEAGHLPVVPDVGDCFDDADRWWTVDCGSDLALYETVDVIPYDEPVQDMSEEQAETDGAACNSDWYWKVTDGDGRTSAILCANDV
jgi:hypothetical protein